MKKLSFVIPTVERFDYLEICLNSLSKTIRPNNLYINLTIVDDASSDKKVISFIENYSPTFCDEINKIFKTTRTPGLCETNLKEIWSLNYDLGYDYFCNLDPDAILNPNWLIKVINLHDKVGTDSIITPFDTESHGRVKVSSDYVKKDTIGGICMFFDKNIYKNFVEPMLYPSPGWDWEVCKNFKNFYCTNPSYIDHIGKVSSARDSNLIPFFDRAVNFIGE